MYRLAICLSLFGFCSQASASSSPFSLKNLLPETKFNSFSLSGKLTDDVYSLSSSSIPGASIAFRTMVNDTVFFHTDITYSEGDVSAEGFKDVEYVAHGANLGFGLTYQLDKYIQSYYSIAFSRLKIDSDIDPLLGSEFNKGVSYKIGALIAFRNYTQLDLSYSVNDLNDSDFENVKKLNARIDSFFSNNHSLYFETSISNSETSQSIGYGYFF